MKVYNYNEITKEYIGQGNAQLNPRPSGDHDKFLRPGNATFIEPSFVKEGYVNCFDESTQSWIAKKDNRGVYYNKQTKQQEIINELDKDIPDYLTKLKPNSEFDKWENDNWIFDLDLYKKYSIGIIKRIRHQEFTNNEDFFEIMYDVIMANIDLEEMRNIKEKYDIYIYSIQECSSKEQIDQIIKEVK